MKIKVKISVSERNRIVNLEPDDFGLTDEQWNDLSEEAKSGMVSDYIDNFDQPYWDIDSIDVSEN